MSSKRPLQLEGSTWKVSPMRRDLRGMRLPLALMVASLGVLVPGLLGAGDVYAIASGLVAVTGLVLGALRFTNAPLVKGEPVALALDEASLTFGARRLHRASLSQGVQHPVEDGVLVQLRGPRWREPTVLHVDDAATADALLAELALDAEGRTAHFWAQSALMATRWYVPSLISASLALIALLVYGAAAGWPGQLVFALVGCFALLTLSSGIPILFSVGLDGISVRKLTRTEFIPWHRIVRVTPFRAKSIVMESGGIEIEVAGRAAPLRLPMATDHLAADTPERLAARIEQARVAATTNQTNLTLVGSPVERVRAARAVLEGQPGYREGHVAPEAVSALVLDPQAAPEDRLAAAKALAGSEAGRARVRIAANTTAERSLRDALTSAIAEAEVEESAEAAVLHRR